MDSHIDSEDSRQFLELIRDPLFTVFVALADERVLSAETGAPRTLAARILAVNLAQYQAKYGELPAGDYLSFAAVDSLTPELATTLADVLRSLARHETSDDSVPYRGLAGPALNPVPQRQYAPGARVLWMVDGDTVPVLALSSIRSGSPAAMPRRPTSDAD